jgi:hypothetical protein
MQAVTTIGLDIAKSIFQVHGVDADGSVIIRRKLKRRYLVPFFQKLPPCLVGIEACGSSHHWSRELQALGHTFRDLLRRRRQDPVGMPRRTLSRHRRRTDSDPNVWSGRASQEVLPIWRMCGLASMYPASDLERIWLRAIMDISARAISLADRPRTGHSGHQCSHAPGRPILHLVSSSRRPRRVRSPGLHHRVLIG